MTRCKFTSRQTGQEVEGVIEADWEVSLDPISDDYTPEEVSAGELLKQWAKQVQQKYPARLIPTRLSKAAAERVFEKTEWKLKVC